MVDGYYFGINMDHQRSCRASWTQPERILQEDDFGYIYTELIYNVTDKLPRHTLLENTIINLGNRTVT